jgi:nitrogen regulatory protein PII
MDSKIEFLIVIGGRNEKTELLSTLSDCGAAVCHVVYGKGAVYSNELLKALSLVPERNKVVIISLIKSDKIENCINLLNNKHRFNESYTGIAFSVPVEAVVY